MGYLLGSAFRANAGIRLDFFLSFCAKITPDDTIIKARMLEGNSGITLVPTISTCIVSLGRTKIIVLLLSWDEDSYPFSFPSMSIVFSLR